MRTISKLLLAAALLVPVGAFAAQSSLVVNITVSIAATIDLEWETTGVAPKNWLPAIAVNSSRQSSADALDLDITNKTADVPAVTISAQITTASPNWVDPTVAAHAAAADTYALQAIENGGAPVDLVTDSAVAVKTNLAKDAATVNLKLELFTPTTITAGKGSSGAIQVTFTAAAY